MFDTVAYACWLALLEALKGGSLPPGWCAMTFQSGDEFHGYEKRIQHELFDVRLFVKSGTIRKVEANLPKLLFGHNGRLIESDAQLAAALAALKALLQTVCEPYGRRHGFFPGDAPDDLATHYTRVDLVWQFDLDPAFLFLALRNAKHPGIDKRTGEYSGETLILPGTNLRISAYDKKRKMRATCSHHVSRIELQLSGEVLNTRFGVAGGILKGLSFTKAWQVYRDTLLQFRFPPIPTEDAKGTIADFIALLEVMFPGNDLVDLYCYTKQMCPRKSRDLRKEVGARVPCRVGFSFEALLPLEGPPPPVIVANPRKEQLLRQYMERLDQQSRVVFVPL